ncbi:MAG: acetate/propionate family kinase [Steroidobacteraceae bacterium]
MVILTLNCGSSSIKAALIDVERERRLLDVRVTNIGSEEGSLEIDGTAQRLGTVDQARAVSVTLATIGARSKSKPAAVAHRVAHGGSRFTQPVLIDDGVVEQLDALSSLAPLHNPVSVAGIRAARNALPAIPHIAVFDTALYADLPPSAQQYAMPVELMQRLGIRRFGFHGTSHAFVAAAAAKFLRKPLQSLRIISCHLGNGASVTAFEQGRSVETSMGMTPLEGLIMGTRAGDIDAGVLLYLLRSADFDVESLDELLNSQSGLKGLTGTNDMREIEERADRGAESCRLAIDAYAHRILKYIGAYAAIMGGVEAIVFTAGIGENSATVRARVADRLGFLGADADADANRRARVDVQHPVARISTVQSNVELLVVRTDEELAMAQDVKDLLAK